MADVCLCLVASWLCRDTVWLVSCFLAESRPVYHGVAVVCSCCWSLLCVRCVGLVFSVFVLVKTLARMNRINEIVSSVRKRITDIFLSFLCM